VGQLAIGEFSKESLGDQLVRSLRLLQNAAQRASRIHPEVDPMSVPLLFRVAKEPSRLSTLAAAFHAELSTISRQVSHLVELGLLRREPDPSDGRASVLVITDEGIALCTRMRQRRDGWIDRLVADWPAEDRERLATLLARFADALEHSDLDTLKDLP
jgi:DNA-binding MarR family transcriptional regulator